ncbi:MAG: Veg family protein [Bacillota bacterium]
MAPKKVLAEIKQDLDSFVGNKIRLKANRGRNKVVERVGVLERTYPNIFVVRLDEKRSERRVSYSYSDVLTETVELVVCHQDGDIRIVGAR